MKQCKTNLSVMTATRETWCSAFYNGSRTSLRVRR